MFYHHQGRLKSTQLSAFLGPSDIIAQSGIIVLTDMIIMNVSSASTPHVLESSIQKCAPTCYIDIAKKSTVVDERTQ